MLSQTALFILLVLFSLVEEKSLENDQCVGIRREDHSYDFELPSDVGVNVQSNACDAEWTVDQNFTAILDGNSTNFSHPFKNVSRRGINVMYCPVSVRFHVSCPKYTRELKCSCINSTDNPVFSTSLPSRDISPSGSTKRQHYCAIAVAVTFVTCLVILAFYFCRTDGTPNCNEQKPACSEELT